MLQSCVANFLCLPQDGGSPRWSTIQRLHTSLKHEAFACVCVCVRRQVPKEASAGVQRLVPPPSTRQHRRTIGIDAATSFHSGTFCMLWSGPGSFHNCNSSSRGKKVYARSLHLCSKYCHLSFACRPLSQSGMVLASLLTAFRCLPQHYFHFISCRVRGSVLGLCVAPILFSIFLSCIDQS